MLSCVLDLVALMEDVSMSHVMISEEDLQKLDRAGLAHMLYEQQDFPVSYTPQQMEFAFMTLHNANE